MEGSRRPYDATKVPKSSVWEDMRRYDSSWGMTEEQVKIWSKHEEPENVFEGGSSGTDGVDSEGMYYKGCANDDRYRRAATGSDISTFGGGISMVAGGSSSKPDTY